MMKDHDLQQLEELLRPLFHELSSSDSEEGFEEESGVRKAIEFALQIPIRQNSKLDQTEPPELKGQRIGQYEIGDRIGSGGMGVVYRARHIHLQTDVAIKILPHRRAANPSSVARFEREMRLQANVDHLNVVTAVDGGVDDGQYYVVMKYVDGIDGAKAVAQLSKLPVEAASEIVRQAALGLQHLHKHDLVHRDIKPANMIVGYDGIVRLIDFGLARVEADNDPAPLTQTDQVLGTVSYMAPEQFTGSLPVTLQSDIYSLGAAFHYLLTGRAPARFASSETGSATSAEECGNEIQPDVALTLDRFLAVDPHQRFSTAAEAAEALVDLADTDSLTVVVERLKADTTSGAQPSALPATTTRLGEVSGPSTLTERRDAEVAERTRRRSTHWRPRKSVTFWLATALLALVFAAIIRGVVMQNDADRQFVEQENTAPGRHPSSTSAARTSVAGAAQGHTLHTHDDIQIQSEFDNERRVATMLLERGGELLLYPTKRVDSVANLPVVGFRILNIDAAQAGITDADCLAIGTLTAVKSLYMGDNPLTGEGLRHFNSFKRLQWLYLGSCNIGDGGMRYLLPHGANLLSLDLTNSDVTDTGLRQLIGFRALRELLIGRNHITDDGLEGLERFPSLMRLSVTETKITDAGLIHLASCPQLKFLILDGTSVTDEGVGTLVLMDQLEALSIRDTAISAQGVERLRRAIPGCEVTWQ